MNLLAMQGNMMLSSSMALTGTLPNGTVGVAYSANLTLTGAYTTPITMDVSSGTLPSWMTVSQSLPNINYAGTPTTAETETFTPRATDSSGTPRVATDPQSIVIASASADPAFVKGNTNYSSTAVTSSTAWFNDADHSAHAASGNLLVAHFYTISSRLCNGSGGAPTGWTLTKTQSNGTVTLQVFNKISDGTETSITITTASTYARAIAITEWSSAKLGSVSYGTVSIPAAYSWSAGPTDTPAYANSIPMFGVNKQNARTGSAPVSPWVGQLSGGGAYINGSYGYQTAPNAAVTYGQTSSSNTSGPAAWVNVWIDPA